MGGVAPPIFPSSLFVFEKLDDLHSAMADHPFGPPHHYSRVSNPTLAYAEDKIAALEGSEKCILTGSGQGAITTAMIANVQAGSHVVTLDTIYGPARVFLSEYMARFGVTTTYVTGLDTDELLDAVKPETTLIYLESPSSLLFRLQDVRKIASFAKEKGIVTAIDNTYNTPLHMNPISMGIDIVVHSATKYLAGHSDITAGAVCGSRERLESMTRYELNLLGTILHPFSAWLLNRGLRTLNLRLARHESTANLIAGWIATRPEVERVHHVSLPCFPQRELYLQMMSGSGGLFSFEPKTQDPQKIKRFVDSLELFQRGVSWGGFESLAVALQQQPLDYSEPKWLVRLFCGLEEPDDLMRDLQQAWPRLSD